jgi:hypothetical protein
MLTSTIAEARPTSAKVTHRNTRVARSESVSPSPPSITGASTSTSVVVSGAEAVGATVADGSVGVVTGTLVAEGVSCHGAAPARGPTAISSPTTTVPVHLRTRRWTQVRRPDVPTGSLTFRTGSGYPPPTLVAAPC